jgi:hypothetical protein
MIVATTTRTRSTVERCIFVVGRGEALIIVIAVNPALNGWCGQISMRHRPRFLRA